MKTKEKTFGELKVGDEFYAVDIKCGYITKRKVLRIQNIGYTADNMIQLVIVDVDSTDYKNDSHANLFPKDFSLYGMLHGAYATTIKSAKEFIKHWEKISKQEIKEKADRMMELLNIY